MIIKYHTHSKSECQVRMKWTTLHRKYSKAKTKLNKMNHEIISIIMMAKTHFMPQNRCISMNNGMNLKALNRFFFRRHRRRRRRTTVTRWWRRRRRNQSNDNSHSWANLFINIFVWVRCMSCALSLSLSLFVLAISALCAFPPHIFKKYKNHSSINKLPLTIIILSAIIVCVILILSFFSPFISFSCLIFIRLWLLLLFFLFRNLISKIRVWSDGSHWSIQCHRDQ